MDIGLLEKPSAVSEMTFLIAIYAFAFMSTGASWLAIEILSFGRFDPKFGRFGTFAAQELMCGVAMLGAVVVFLLARRRSYSLPGSAVHSCLAAILTLLIWKITQLHAVLDRLIGLTSPGDIVVGQLLRGLTASLVVEAGFVLLRLRLR